jgi:hypothetical protein
MGSKGNSVAVKIVDVLDVRDPQSNDDVWFGVVEGKRL